MRVSGQQSWNWWTCLQRMDLKTKIIKKNLLKKKNPTTYKIIYTVRERSLMKQTHIRSTSESDNTYVIRGTSKTIISFVIIIF